MPTAFIHEVFQLSTAARPRRTFTVVLGLIIVVVAFLGVLIFSRLAGPPAPKYRVLGAAHDIKTGTVLTASDLTVITLDAQPTGAILEDSQTSAVGKVARNTIQSGKPVLDSDLATPAIGAPVRLYFTLPSGKVAINIPAGDISPYVQPGDTIDIIASPRAAANAAPGTPGQQYKTTLKGLLVLAVGAPQAAAQGQAAVGGNLIVEAGLQDAEAIEFLIKNTDFTYVLRSPLDKSNADAPTSGMDINTFKATYGFK